MTKEELLERFRRAATIPRVGLTKEELGIEAEILRLLRLASAVPAGRPRCPKCQSPMEDAMKRFSANSQSAVRVFCEGKDLSHHQFQIYRLSDFAQFFAPSPATGQHIKASFKGTEFIGTAAVPAPESPLPQESRLGCRKCDAGIEHKACELYDKSAAPPTGEGTKYSRPECHLKCCEDPAKCKRLGVCHHHYRHAEPAAQPESAAKVEEIAEELVFNFGVQGHLMNYQTVRDFLRPYIPSQPPAEIAEEFREYRLWMTEQINWLAEKWIKQGDSRHAGEMLDLLRVTPVSQPPANERLIEDCAMLLRLAANKFRKSDQKFADKICDFLKRKNLIGNILREAAPVTPVSQPPTFDDGLEYAAQLIDRVCEGCDCEHSKAYARLIRARKDKSVAPVSGNGPEPPQISNNGTCSCCGTKLVRQELTLPHYVDWCSNCQTWAGAQPTPKGEKDVALEEAAATIEQLISEAKTAHSLTHTVNCVCDRAKNLLAILRRAGEPKGENNG